MELLFYPSGTVSRASWEDLPGWALCCSQVHFDSFQNLVTAHLSKEITIWMKTIFSTLSNEKNPCMFLSFYLSYPGKTEYSSRGIIVNTKIYSSERISSLRPFLILSEKKKVYFLFKA